MSSGGIGRWADSSDDEEEEDHHENVYLTPITTDITIQPTPQQQEQWNETNTDHNIHENGEDENDHDEADDEHDDDEEEDEEDDDEKEDEEERQRRIEEAKLAAAEKLMQQQSKVLRTKSNSNKKTNTKNVDDDLDDILNEFGIDTTLEVKGNNVSTDVGSTNPESIDGINDAVAAAAAASSKRKKNKKKKTTTTSNSNNNNNNNNNNNTNGEEESESHINTAETDPVTNDTVVVDVTKLLKAKAAIAKPNKSKKLSVAAAVAVKELQQSTSNTTTATTTASKKKKKMDKLQYER